MKQLSRAAVVCLAVVSFLFSFTAMAQVQTARPNVNVSARCKGYYEYLPQGYDPAGTATYPMILFFTGIGEFGNGGSSELSRVLKNGPPKLIKDGTFPTSFSVLGQTLRPIVITPQFVTGSSPSAADVDTVLQYMLAHYKVNPNRVYLTGLSYGGGLSFAYPGNRNTSYAARIAAIVPTASPLPLPKETGYDTIYARSRVIAAANIPVWATHNKYDRYPDSSLNTITYVNDINLAPAPNPLAKMTIFSASGHDSWTKTYDPDYRENGYNVYEWMLLFEKGVPPPPPNKAPKVNAGSDKVITLPTNSVTITAAASDSDGTIASYSWKQLYGPASATITSGTTASPTFSALVQGYYMFRVTASDDKGAKATDDVMVTVNYVNVAGTKYINVNVYGGANGYSSTAWNNWNVGTSAATNKTSAAFKYSDGTTSTVSAVLSATSTVSDNGATYNGGMAPAQVLRYTSYYTGTRTLTITGLSTSKTYNLQLFASRNSSTAYYTTFKVNSDSVKVNAYNNYSNKAVFNNIAPNTSGQIVVTLDKSNTYNYLNGFVITENANTRFVKTNVYGGSNAYSNVEWNNWNVGTVAATNKSSGAMKYSDGTTSNVSAVLSATSSVLDNGSTYGSGMAPAEVLRYNSAYGSQRTLTLSGLSTSKTYNLELYASHKSTTTNNNTIFTINGISITINVNSNLTNKASFTNLVPNSSGQIVVSMNKTATNSYLNGFMLTENTGSGTTIKQSTAPLEVVTERNNPAGAGISVSPNPVTSAVQLRLQNSYKGAVQVQLTDESGRVQQVWHFEKGSTLLQQTLQVTNLSKGVYFVTVQMGATRQALRISKL